jgi:CO/xanthine dehydrogenase Mo-binding subunit
VSDAQASGERASVERAGVEQAGLEQAGLEQAGLEQAGLEIDRYELAAGPAYHFVVSRRTVFRVLGGGLVVVLLARDGAAQESGARSRGRTPQQIGAWLHIAEDGTVTGYTGKVEVGQDARTSLSQAIADELAVPLASVRLVMGDTATTPFDAGTFGSRTTPAMAPQLRKAAACARERLRALAAQSLGVDGKTLVIAAGAVTHPPSGRSLPFGALTHGQKLLEAIGDDAPVTPAARWTVAGQPIPRIDARAVVTGQRRYVSDLTRPGMLRGKVARPPHFGARAESVDATRVRGARVVHDGDFVGVVAPDEDTASRAVSALGVQWTLLDQPAVGSADLVAHLRRTAKAGRTEHAAGDVGAGLAAGTRRLTQSYSTAYIAHAPLEPRAAVAEWQGQGQGDGERLTVWTGTQRPFGVRRELAEAFRLSEDQVRVIVPDTGAGYGGKHTGEAAIEAARLARAAGKPVKLVWTREEEFTWAYFRPAAVVDIRSAIAADGALTAWEARTLNAGTAGLQTPYAVPHQAHVFVPTDAPLRQGSYRALASTANHFARETHMDELAAQAALDPLAFRLRNLTDPRLRAVLQAAAARFGWPRRAAGLACGTEKGGYVATCAAVKIEGQQVRVERLVTAFECGAVVNPDGLRNQVEGAALMGLGGALFEAVDFADGRVLNGRFSSYRVPRFLDLPVLETVLVDRKDLPSAGAGEAPIIAVAPAIGNAIAAATGRRLRSLPLRL